METNEVKDAGYTDISNIQFEIEKPGQASSIINNNPASENNPVTPAGGTSADQLENNPNKDKGAATQNSEANNNQSQLPTNTDTDPSNPELEEPEFEIQPEDLDSLISDAFEGQINSMAEITQRLNRLQEIEENPSLLLQDEKQRKIFDFLSKYPGEDFNTGIQQFVKLQQMDVASMDAKTAIKELFMIKSMQKGMSREDSELMFEHQYESKYDSIGDAGKAFLNSDSIDAKLELRKMQQDALLPKADKQAEQIDLDRENYLSSVHEVFENENGQFKELIISDLTTNPEDNLSFPIPDLMRVQNAVADYGAYWNDRYMNRDGSWNTEQFKEDIAFTLNRDEIIQKVFEHGKLAGKELAIQERKNLPDGNQLESNANQNNTPETMEQAVLKGMGKLA